MNESSWWDIKSIILKTPVTVIDLQGGEKKEKKRKLLLHFQIFFFFLEVVSQVFILKGKKKSVLNSFNMAIRAEIPVPLKS